jgi:hypothetical protein
MISCVPDCASGINSVKNVLTTPRTTTKHYNRAREIEASQAHNQLIARLRRSSKCDDGRYSPLCRTTRRR